MRAGACRSLGKASTAGLVKARMAEATAPVSAAHSRGSGRCAGLFLFAPARYALFVLHNWCTRLSRGARAALTQWAGNRMPNEFEEHHKARMERRAAEEAAAEMRRTEILQRATKNSVRCA